MSNEQSNPIENIVVLMLENRSFDNILGSLYPHSSGFEGLVLDGSMSNTYNNQTYPVTNETSSDTFTVATWKSGPNFKASLKCSMPQAAQTGKFIFTTTPWRR